MNAAITSQSPLIGAIVLTYEKLSTIIYGELSQSPLIGAIVLTMLQVILTAANIPVSIPSDRGNRPDSTLGFSKKLRGLEGKIRASAIFLMTGIFPYRLFVKILEQVLDSS